MEALGGHTYPVRSEFASVVPDVSEAIESGPQFPSQRCQHERGLSLLGEGWVRACCPDDSEDEAPHIRSLEVGQARPGLQGAGRVFGNLGNAI